MPVTGPLSHIDISVGYPDRSIPFYDALFTSMKYKRWRGDSREWQEPNPVRATWWIRYSDGTSFGVEVRPARESSRHRRYDRYEPGPHHIAFHAESCEMVDDVYQKMMVINADILDAPAQYGGQKGYGESYYAVFIADPDNIKLEVAYVPASNP